MFSTCPQKRVAAPAILAISALLPAGAAAAANFTWDGDAPSDNFSDADNWNPSGAPGLDLLGCNFIFAGTAGVDQFPNVGLNYFNIGGITFTGADAAYTIGGNGSFTFDDMAMIINDSAIAQTINVDLIGTVDFLVLDAMAGDLIFGGSIDLSDTVDMDGVQLTVQGGFNTTINGRILGADGSLLKDGAGILELNGFNQFTGGTTLMAGTIVLGHTNALGTGDLTVTGNSNIESDDDGRVIFNDIAIDNGITLTVSGDTDLNLVGVISDLNDMGAGVLMVDMTADNDRLVLRGENTYTGGTTLNKGTIVLSTDTALGTGDLTLTGDGEIQSNLDDRVIDNNIHLNANTLTLGGARDLQLDGDIDGAGALTKIGVGVARLSGTNTYTGDTNINNGTLILLGLTSSITSAVNVANAATFGGDGMMTGLLTNAGTVAPGEVGSIGTLNVTGDYVQELGSTLAVQLSADPLESDLLDVTGNVTLGVMPGDVSTISVSVVGDGFIIDGQSFTVIQAGGTLTDNGAEVVTESATVTIDFIGNANPGSYDVLLTRAANAYVNAADAGNNTAIGAALDSLQPVAEDAPTGAAGILLGQLDTLNAADYNTAVNQLSPEPYNASTGAAIQNGVSFTTQQTSYLATKRSGIESWARSMQSSRPLPGSLASAHTDTALLAAAFAEMQEPPLDTTRRSEPRLGGYAKVQAIFSNQDTTANRTGYDVTALGGQMGIDYRFTRDVLAGVAVGYTFNRADLDSDLGEIDDNTVRVGPYFSWVRGDWYLDGSATFGYHFFDNERNIPALGLTAQGDYNGYDVVAYVGTGYQVELTDHFYLTPMTSIQYSYFHFDSFTESGAGGANLTIGARDTDSLRTRLGVNLSYELDMGTLVVPFVYGGWEHEFLKDDEIEASFATGGSPFTIDTGTRNEDSGFLGVGLHVLLDPYVSGFIRYEHSFADDGDVSGIAAGLSFVF